MDKAEPGQRRHIILTSHPGAAGPSAAAIRWGAPTAQERGPIVATTTNPTHRNAIGTHAGSYGVYRALAIAARQLSPLHKPDLTDTAPAETIGPYPQWTDADKIVSLDPWGHMVGEAFHDRLVAGWDIRPTIAVTKAHIHMPELRDALAKQRLRADGAILLESGAARVTKIAVDPVWYLPGMARRFGISETALRRSLFEHCGGIFPELVTRPDLSVFLPPIGGTTIYLIGRPTSVSESDKPIACRVHDECNGSDVFGSDICTCRPYLAHGVEVCIQAAQEGGCGIIVYNRKEGRALGEVTKFLVYNARKRQAGGDRAETYFERTECVAGVQDMRFQQLMPDVLHWLGVSRIDRFVSMSDLKFAPLIESGIKVVERIEIPEELIPADAKVEMDAKKAAGYFTVKAPTPDELSAAKGRGLKE
jgi:GTP cyclohydrolase II